MQCIFFPARDNFIAARDELRMMIVSLRLFSRRQGRSSALKVLVVAMTAHSDPSTYPIYRLSTRTSTFTSTMEAREACNLPAGQEYTVHILHNRCTVTQAVCSTHLVRIRFNTTIHALKLRLLGSTDYTDTALALRLHGQQLLWALSDGTCAICIQHVCMCMWAFNWYMTLRSHHYAKQKSNETLCPCKPEQGLLSVCSWRMLLTVQIPNFTYPIFKSCLLPVRQCGQAICANASCVGAFCHSA